jgi:hypothetical protein
MAPAPEPSQASEFARAGTERELPRSAAIGFRATGARSGAPYENVRMNRTTLAAAHDAFVSMLGAAVRSTDKSCNAGTATTSVLIASRRQ